MHEVTRIHSAIEQGEAPEKLAVQDPAKAKLVELRYFAGLSGDQAAASL